MSDAPNIEAPAAPVAEAPAVTPAAPAAPATPPATPPADPAQPEQEVAAPAGPPESYQFAAPEGTELDPVLIGAYSEAARELGLPQDKAQMVIDKIAPLMAKQQEAAFAAYNEHLKAQVFADPEIGGANVEASIKYAKAALDQFATPALIDALNTTHLGNHPEVIRLLAKIGRQVTPDNNIVTGQSPAGTQTKTLAERLYGGGTSH